jgi:hypothetical protein
MSNDERRAAEQLDAAITARQSGRAEPSLDAPNRADAALAASLVDAARSASLDPSFAARLERDLMELHERRSASPLAALAQRWDALTNGLAQGFSRSAGWAVAATLLIALASFVLFRNVQPAGPTGPATQPPPPTQAPIVLNVTATPTPTATQPAATATSEPSATPAPVVAQSTATSVPPKATPEQKSPTPRPAQPTATRTPTTAPTRAPTATPSKSPTPTAGAANVTSIKITMFDVDGTTPGKHIGCGDTVVMVERNIPATAAPLSAAIREQLSIHDQFYGMSGLFNALYQSNLSFVSATIVDGHATINLSGTIRVNGVCDMPRVASQFEETALQFSTVQSVTTNVNGVEINKAMSQK